METWKCTENCEAKCCGIVPIPISTYNLFKRRIKKKIIDKMKLKSHIVLMTEDASCVFLDNKCKCLIYEHRPKLCKSYGMIEELQCPYVDMNGNARTEQDVLMTKDLIESQYKTRIGMIK